MKQQNEKNAAAAAVHTLPHQKKTEKKHKTEVTLGIHRIDSHWICNQFTFWKRSFNFRARNAQIYMYTAVHYTNARYTYRQFIVICTLCFCLTTHI